MTARGDALTLAPTATTAAPAAISAPEGRLARAGYVSAHHGHLLPAWGHALTLAPTQATAAPAAMPAALLGMLALTANARVAQALPARKGRLARAGSVLSHQGLSSA